jgi:hypothetical protein
MAETARRAAGQRYEVHEVLGDDPGFDLGLRFETEDFGSAVDYAFDYLERRDPHREGVVTALEIVRVADADRETVWSYTHALAIDEADTTRVFGFDVTRSWSPHRAPARPLVARH